MSQDKIIKKLQSQAERMHEKEPAYKRYMNLEMLVLLVFAILIAISCNTFLFRIIRVDGPSMLPTFVTDQRVFVDRVTYKVTHPKRYDVIICYYNHNGRLIKGDDPVIKRVIGLENETIEIKDGVILINGNELDESYYWDDLINNDMDEYTIPPGSIFVVGDNRNNSLDSRDKSIREVPYKNIVGMVRARIWPVQDFTFFNYNSIRAEALGK